MSDYEFTLLTPPATDLRYALTGFASDSVRHVVAADSSSSFAWQFLKLLKGWKPDLVHSHGFTSAALATPSVSWGFTPHLVTSHDVLTEGQFHGAKGAARRWALGVCLRRATHVMAVGNDALANLREAYPVLTSENQSSAIANGIDVDRFLKDDRRNLKQELALPSDALLIGFFGRFMGQKGFIYLVNAVERLRNQGVDAQVACFGWGGFIREEQRMLRRRQLEQAFHFLPQTDDMLAALRGVDIVAAPSRWEACPLLPMEALVAGVPLVASDCIGMREVVANTPALTFSTGSVEELVQRLEAFLLDRANHMQRAREFRETAASRFDSNHSARGLSRLYSQLLGLQGA